MEEGQSLSRMLLQQIEDGKISPSTLEKKVNNPMLFEEHRLKKINCPSASHYYHTIVPLDKVVIPPSLIAKLKKRMSQNGNLHSDAASLGKKYSIKELSKESKKYLYHAPKGQFFNPHMRLKLFGEWSKVQNSRRKCVNHTSSIIHIPNSVIQNALLEKFKEEDEKTGESSFASIDDGTESDEENKLKEKSLVMNSTNEYELLHKIKKRIINNNFQEHKSYLYQLHKDAVKIGIHSSNVRSYANLAASIKDIEKLYAKKFITRDRDGSFRRRVGSKNRAVSLEKYKTKIEKPPRKLSKGMRTQRVTLTKEKTYDCVTLPKIQTHRPRNVQTLDILKKAQFQASNE